MAIYARGRLFGGPPTRLELATFTAEGGGQRITLAGPATLTYGSDGLDIKDLGFRVGAGRLSLSGHSGSTLALKASAAGVPLTAVDLFSPGLGLSGIADGEANIGELQTPRPASGRRVCSACSFRKCATPGCPRLTSPAPAGWRAGEHRLMLRSTRGLATPSA